ncbi:MAG: hypothetical protein ACWGSQ_16930 [Longimicrobiales bacterium]
MAMLAQLPTPASDTVVVMVPPSFLATTEAVSTILLTVVVLGLLIAILNGLIQVRRLSRSLGLVLERLERDAGPVVDRARSVAENVDFITAVVRTDVQKLNESVARLNDRLKEASERMEERIQDFTALVEVLQSEAEDLALDTAAAVRGVKAGTRSLAQGSKGAPKEEGHEGVPLLSADEGI